MGPPKECGLGRCFFGVFHYLLTKHWEPCSVILTPENLFVCPDNTAFANEMKMGLETKKIRPSMRKGVGFLAYRPESPLKINMELTKHPFKKEHDLPNLHDYGPC